MNFVLKVRYKDGLWRVESNGHKTSRHTEVWWVEEFPTLTNPRSHYLSRKNLSIKEVYVKQTESVLLIIEENRRGPVKM